MAHYDVVVLGCGPAGERAAIQASRAGRKVAVVERYHLVGGNRVNWGTIPSKSLRESAVFFYQLTRGRLHGIRYEVSSELTVADFMQRERVVVKRELELIGDSLGRYAVDVIEGHARFAGPNAVAVRPSDGSELRTLTADYFVIATGSRPNRPDDVPFDGETVFDSETILQLPRIPKTMTVLGAGVVGIEYASIFAALGIAVTLVDTRDRLLPYFDREIVATLVRELGELGVSLLHDDRYARITRLPGTPPRVACETKAGRRLESDVDPLLRRPRRQHQRHRPRDARDHAGQVRPARGERALPDRPPAHLRGGRRDRLSRARQHLDGAGAPGDAPRAQDPRTAGRTDTLPFAVYSIPEVAYVGATEESLVEKQVDYVSGRGDYSKNPRAQILGDSDGLVKLLFEWPSLELKGAHIVGTSASELIHIGEAFLHERSTATEIAETIYNYPTLSDMYRHAAVKALGEDRKRREKRS